GGCHDEALTTDQPPSTTRFAPVTNEASEEARNATAAATSSGRPNRPATVSATLAARPSASTRSHAAVRIGPGTTVLTRTRGPYSTASCRPNAHSAPLLAA